jgi:hypothetical protein
LVRRRSYSQPDIDIPGLRRNVGGARHEATERITLRRGDFVASGWTLNLSRGGVRVVLEDTVALGGEYTITIGPEGEDTALVHLARVVWLQDEADGQIAGIQFLDQEGSIPAPPGPRPA